MLNKNFEKEMNEIFKNKFSSSFEKRVLNSYDATNKNILPDYVLYAENEQDVIQCCKICSKYKIPVIPRGAGCGFSGGALAVNGGLSLVLDKMNSIEIDNENLIAIVEPGATTYSIQKKAEKFNLFYPPDPSSLKISTIGGNIAENAGGPRAVKYGVTKDWVIALEVILINGEKLYIGKPLKKDVAGYNLTGLFVGSEGTLGIITKAYLKLIPKPEGFLSGIFMFDSIKNAAKAISKIIAEGFQPSKLEFMDKFSLNALRKAGKDVPEKAEAVVLIEVDGEKKSLFEKLERIRKKVEEIGLIDFAIAKNEGENERIWELRRSLSPIINLYGNTKMNEDVVVPRSEIPNLLDYVENLIQQFNLTIVCFGHAGDGNIHVNFMFNKEDTETVKKVETALDLLFKKVIELGGSISGEHGIGIAKKKFMKYQFSEKEIELFREIKNVFDPDNLLNPGKIFDME
ncbi:glycolate oxidase [Thermotomaculum hydrothermale]|uniref:Glycolate oxidase n=1 Tax=Thermotomaculum hydrothermale TaxID=981385 RepID=A0A7R6SYV4_9BACT|nr:FAD-linked oxidase C-terminal domain-containing protein [Thermotomaculum hydrothermale]BBB33055.1 glycolate oxidase [Thermotomaculum hydrothermale]